MNRIVIQLAAILHREIRVRLAAVFWALSGLSALPTHAQEPPVGFQTRPYNFQTIPPAAPELLSMPTGRSRLTARDLGLVINTADPYSVAVGEFYIRARRLDPSQVLRTTLPVTAALNVEQFRSLQGAIESFFGKRAEVLALAWRLPYAVGCNSITGALALGFDAGLCAHTCAASSLSRYFNARTTRPRTDLSMRPSMLLAARDVEGAKAMILRGVAADGRLGLRGGPPARAYFVRTSDAARSTRAPLFPPAGTLPRVNLEVHIEATDALDHVDRVVVYETGLIRVPHLDTIGWLPGALADHLTSFGGVLDGSGQMPATDWIASGATASYGTVSEPCSHPEKFPHPQILLSNYLQGATAIEAYWKSVAWPQQGLFIGEPLAAPFARR